MCAEKSNVLWIGGVKIDDLLNTKGDTLPSRVVERKQELVNIFQRLSDNNIQEPIARNFHYDWSRKWIICVFTSEEVATKVKDCFDTFVHVPSTPKEKEVKEARRDLLASVFPKQIDWSSFVVDYKKTKITTKEFKSPTLTPFREAITTDIVTAEGKKDIGLPHKAIVANPSIHGHKWRNSSLALSVAAAKVGHSNANNVNGGFGPLLYASDGSNVSMQKRSELTPDMQPHQPSLINIVESNDRRTALIKVELPLDMQCMVAVVPLGRTNDETSIKYTQNIVI